VTWGPVEIDASGQTYQVESDRVVTIQEQLRVHDTTVPIPWTAALASGVWAVDAFYAPGLDFQGNALPASFNADLLTFGPGSAGTTRYSGRSFTWSLSGGDLVVRFSDGSTERIRIMGQESDLYGVWYEHTDASGALLGGNYGWAFRAPYLPMATTALFSSAAGEYWQGMINAWIPEQWSGADFTWANHFGWELHPDGTAANLQASLTPTIPPVQVLSELPGTWLVTAEGQARENRYAFTTGENRAYRVWTPVVFSADGNRVYVIEEEHRRRNVASPYGFFIVQRITMLQRWTIPTP
jgi:hypothetical protein